jgi:putative transposase
MKHDLKAQLVWIPKYRKKVLTGQVALRVRDLIRQIPMEHEVGILSGKVASDHIHVLVAYRPHVDISRIVQWLKEISSRILLQEFAHLRKAFWRRHLWARGYLAVSNGGPDGRVGAGAEDELECTSRSQNRLAMQWIRVLRRGLRNVSYE